MKKLSILFLGAIAVFASACEKVMGEGELRTETRSTGNFTGIDSRVSGNIFYVSGNDHKIELTAQQNILDIIETPVVNNRVVIKFKSDVRVRNHQQVTIKITAPSVSNISASGSGNVTVSNAIAGNNLYFSLSGSGNMIVPSISATHLEADISGSGNLDMGSGSTTTAQYSVSGSGRIHAQGVLAESVNATISGSGDIKLTASKTLNARISGSGSVLYLGSPIITSTISGSGRVTHL